MVYERQPTMGELRLRMQREAEEKAKQSATVPRFEAYEEDLPGGETEFCILDNARSDSFGCYFFGHCENKEDRDMILKALSESKNAVP